MYEVDFLFVGGTGMNTTLPMEAIEQIKALLSEGKPVTVTGRNMDSTIFPHNLLMIQVGKNLVNR